MVPNVKSMDSQREPKACEAILQAVEQRDHLIPEVLDMINETWTKFRREEFMPSRLADNKGWATRMVVLSKTKQTGIRPTCKAFTSFWKRYCLWCVVG